MVLEKTLESPLTCKEIQPVNAKGNQSWIFIGRTDTEAETPILWPPDAKSWLIRKENDAGKYWGQEEKGATEDEMLGWHHRLDGHALEQALEVGDGRGSPVCCSPWGHWELDMTDWTESRVHMTAKGHQNKTRIEKPCSLIEKIRIVCLRQTEWQAPKDSHIMIPGICYMTWQHQGCQSADLKWTENPGLSRCARFNLQRPWTRKEESQRHDKMKGMSPFAFHESDTAGSADTGGGTRSHGGQAASRSWKQQQHGFSPRVSRQNTALPTQWF